MLFHVADGRRQVHIGYLTGVCMGDMVHFMNPRVYLRVTVGELARAGGFGERTVRDHIRRGLVDPADLVSVSGYVASCVLAGTPPQGVAGEVLESLPAEKINLEPAVLDPSDRSAASKAKLAAFLGDEPEAGNVEEDEEEVQLREEREFAWLERMMYDGGEMSVEELERYRELKGTAVEKRVLKRMGR